MGTQSKRRVGVLAGLSIALLATGCSVSSQEAPADTEEEAGSITFVTYGSNFSESQKTAWTDPFTEETGISVVDDSPVDLAKLQVMVDSGNVTWDVYVADPYQTQAYCGELFEPLDLTDVDLSQYVEGTTSECGLPGDTYSVALVYNEDVYGDNPPTSIADFFDLEKYPGTRSLYNGPINGVLEHALLADGVAPEDIYPIDYDRAFAKLDTIKPELTTWTTGAEQVEMLTAESADMAIVWTARGYEAAAAGAPYVPVWDANAYAWVELAVVAGSENAAAANEFIQYATSPEPQARFVEEMAYGTANTLAEPELSDDRLAWDPSAPEHLDQAFIRDMAWWADNQEEATERWLEWIQQ